MILLSHYLFDKLRACLSGRTLLYLFSLLCVLLFVFRFSHIEWIEYSPKLVAIRRVDSWGIPLVLISHGAPNIGDWYRTTTMEWLVNTYSLANTESPILWYAVHTGVPKKGSQGEFSALVEMLSEPDWIDWSMKHPETAKAVWSTFKLMTQEWDASEIGLYRAQEFLEKLKGIREDDAKVQTLIAEFEDKKP